MQSVTVVLGQVCAGSAEQWNAHTLNLSLACLDQLQVTWCSYFSNQRCRRQEESSTWVEKSPALLSGMLVQVYKQCRYRLQTIPLPRPREHQVRVPRSFRTSVQLTSTQSKDMRFSVWKFRHEIRVDLCDCFPPAL